MERPSEVQWCWMDKTSMLFESGRRVQFRVPPLKSPRQYVHRNAGVALRSSNGFVLNPTNLNAPP